MVTNGLQNDIEGTPLLSPHAIPSSPLPPAEIGEDKLSPPLSRWIVPALACALAYSLYNVSLSPQTFIVLLFCDSNVFSTDIHQDGFREFA